MIITPETQLVWGQVLKVYINASEAPESDGSAPAQDLRFDLRINDGGTLIYTERAPNYYPVPALYDAAADQEIYRNKAVPVLKDSGLFYPIIPVYPAVQDCDSPGLFGLTNIAVATGRAASLESFVIQTVRNYMEAIGAQS